MGSRVKRFFAKSKLRILKGRKIMTRGNPHEIRRIARTALALTLKAARFAGCATAALALSSSPALAGTWDVEFAPSPAITTSIDRGAVKMRTRIDVIRLTTPVLRSDLAGAGDYWESRVECKGVGFDDFVDAHFSYRTRGVIRVPASRLAGSRGRDIRAVAVYVHGGYGSPYFWKEINYFPDAAIEGDTLVSVPALARGLAYASFNLAGWDEDGKFTARMLERAGRARPEDPPELVDPETGRLWAFSEAPLKKGDVVSPQSASVARDLIRAAKQAVIVVAGAAGLNGGNTEAPDDLPALALGHSHGAYMTSAMALGMNPIRPGVSSGGNRVDPADLSSPLIAAGAILMAPSFEFLFADVAMPLIPIMLINAEADPFFGLQFTVAARYGEVLAARGLRLRDRVSLWSLGNSAHSPPDILESFEIAFGVRRGGDPWSPFVDAALGHMLRIVSGGGNQRMPASHYDGRLEGDRVVFPQVGAPPTELVPFVVDPLWDEFDDEFAPSQPLPPSVVEDFAAVAQELAPTGHILGPRMANPIGGYRIDFNGAELAAPFEDLGRRYGSWKEYLERSKVTVHALVRAGVYIAPRGKAALIELLDPAAFDAFAAQGLVGSGGK
jgi:hypothetical protein